MRHLMTRSVSPETVLSWIKHRMRPEDKHVNWFIHTWHSLIKHSSTKTVGNTHAPFSPLVLNRISFWSDTYSAHKAQKAEYQISSIHQGNQIKWERKLFPLALSPVRQNAKVTPSSGHWAVLRDDTSDHQFLLVEDGGKKRAMTETNKQTKNNTAVSKWRKQLSKTRRILKDAEHKYFWWKSGIRNIKRPIQRNFFCLITY